MLVYIDRHSQNEKYFIVHLSKTLGQLSCQYNKTMLIGDLNIMINNKSLENFMTTFDLAKKLLVLKFAAFNEDIKCERKLFRQS